MSLTPIKTIDSIEHKVAMTIGRELCVHGVDGGIAYPLAISIIGYIEDGLKANDPQKIIDTVKKHWQDDIKWWQTYHPGKNRKQIALMKRFLQESEHEGL